MILTFQKDVVHSRKISVALNKQKRRISEEIPSDQPTTRSVSVAAEKTMTMPSKLRKLKTLVASTTARVVTLT